MIKKSVYTIFLLLALLPFSLRAQWSATGLASQSAGDDCFRLTTAVSGQRGAAINNSKISLLDTFSITSNLNFGTNNAGGLGIAFFLSANYVSPNSNLDFGLVGLDSLLAVEFDSRRDGADNDPIEDHMAIFSGLSFDHNSTDLLSNTQTLPNIEDGNFHTVSILWAPSTNRDSSLLQISFDCDSVISIQYNLIDSVFDGLDSVYIGYSASTAGFFNNLQEVCIDHVFPLDALEDTILCLNDTITLDAGTGASYLWSPATSISSTTAKNPLIFPSSTSTYFVTITDSCGATREDSITISMNPVSINLNPLAGPQCQRDTVILNGAVSGGFGTNYEFLWNDGYRDSSNTIIATSTQDYIVTVEDVEGCRAADTLTMLVDTIPFFDLGPDSTVCDGDSITLDMGAGLNYSYSWSTGPTSQTIVIDSTIAVIASLTNGLSCTRRDTFSLNWIALPAVNLGNDTSVCLGDNVFLDAGVGWQSYTWSPTNDTTQTIFADSSLTYSVSVTNANLCVGLDSITITVDTLPVIDLGNDTSICQGENLVLTADSNYQAYIWSGGQFNQTATYNTGGTITLVAVDSNGCQSSDSKDLSIDTIPQINLGTDTALCDLDSMFLYSIPNLFTQFWNGDSTNTTDTLKIDTAGTYIITIIDSSLCFSTDTFVLSIDTLPVIDLGPDSNLCDGGQVVLDAGLGYATYIWINNGSSTNTLTVDTTNIYWVEVIDSNGCIGSDTMLFQTDSLPVFDLGPDTAICIDQSITFDPGANYTTYQWNNGPNSQSITVDSAFIYTVNVTTQAGCPGADTIELFINPLPIVNLGNDRELCIGAAINEVLDAGPNFALYEWSQGTTGPEATARTITVNIEDIFIVTVTDINGCQNTDTIETSAVHEPTIDIGLDTSYCEGDDFDFIMNTGSGFIKHIWLDLNRTPPNDTVSKSGQILLVDTAGVYVVEITELFNTRECTNRDTVNVIELPLPTINATGDVTFCENEIFNFTRTAVSRTGYSYEWSNGSTTNSINVTDFGTYRITVTNDTTGCLGTEAFNVLRSLLPEVDLTGDSLVCENQPIKVDATNEGYSYRWVQILEDTSFVISLDSAITVADSGFYRVELDNGFCTYEDSTFIRYDVFPRVFLGENTTLCAGDTLLLNASFSESDVNYLWNDGSNDSIYPARFSGTYSVQVSNGCGVDITNITVNFEDCSKIWVPNAFTPNSDDDNEFFKAYSLESFLEFRLDIFDQWGNIIYTSTDIERQWDGTSFEGSDLPIGTYVWKITYKSQFELGIEGAPTRTLAGRVNLIR